MIGISSEGVNLSGRIAALLSESAFSFTPNEYFSIHRKLNENHPLHNRTLHISGTFKEPEKVNIEDVFASKTSAHVRALREALGYQTVFGRSDVQKILGLKPTRSSAPLREMAEHGIIEPVSGRGKGKYWFR